VLTALKCMRIHKTTTPVPRNDHSDGTSPDTFRGAAPRPPTPPRPSQKRLGEEEALACWGDDSNENADDTAANGIIQNEEAAASSPVDGRELCEAVADKDKEPLEQKRVRTQEERAILERMIFGNEDEELDEAFWETDEGGANEASKSDGLFGSTSTTWPSTVSEDGRPRSHQSEEDGNSAVVQGISGAEGGSASVDTSDGVRSSENASPTVPTSTLPTLPEPSHTAFNPSSPKNHPTSSESGFGVRPTKDEALTGILHPVEVNDGRLDPVPVPITPVSPFIEELEPCKPAVVARSEGEPQCNTMRRIVRKMGLPEFSRPLSFIFSIPAVASSDDGFLGKRKRNCEDDRDDELPVVLPRLVA
jgi:hypothetical protein